MASAMLLLIIGCLVAQPLSAYVLQRGLAQDGSTVTLKWDPASFPLPWQLYPTTGGNVTGSLAAVAQASFQSWLGISTAKISFAQGANTATSVKPGTDGINEITTGLSIADWASYGVNQGVLAFTMTTWFGVPNPGGFIDPASGRTVNFAGQIVDADILFNPSFSYSTSATVPANQYDLQSVLTHEIGHFLGLDHTNLLSSTMFWTTAQGVSYPRNLSSDEAAGISALYPTASFSATGTMSGTVRLTSNNPVFGALVVVVNANGQPVASTITDSNGQYTIQGLAAGAYSVYAEPLDGPLNESNVYSLVRLDPNATINMNFTTRFH